MSENEQIRQKGGISVETEHIFPIIKKWLYSEKDIFLREIVSNSADAVTKMKRLVSLGQADGIPADEKYRITVTLDKTAKTISVADNGIGMTEDEIKRYICQIALSGALDFIQKYEGESEGAGQGIIGHFGLGFYSAFMVSESVDVVSRSYTGAPTVKWICTDAGEYEIVDPGEERTRGTTVVMHIAEDETEYLGETKLRSVLEKYCAFMPVEIYFVDADVKEKAEETDAKDDGKEKEKEEEKPVNDINPLWNKPASECTDEEYKAFYRKVFSDYREPLFWIHLNADYPLNFKGILYFPRIENEFESIEGQVKLYYNQVFVADNIKEVIPEYLLMLKGVLDCPELPLNVSRSYLQNNTYVAKLSAHIVKKVADKLNGMFANEREKYEGLWPDLKTFVEYACIRDGKFYDRVKGSLLLPLTDGKYQTIDEYLDEAKEKHEKTVYYTTDKTAQAQYVTMFTSENIKVAVLDKMIDTQFMNIYESNNEGVKFVRVDADIANALKGDGETKELPKVGDLFKKVSGNDKLKIKYELLKTAKVPAVLNITEESRRMDDMMKLYRMSGGKDGDDSFPADMTLVVNTASPLIERLDAESDGEKAEKIAKEIYYLALLSQRKLNAGELQSFLDDSFGLLEKL